MILLLDSTRIMDSIRQSHSQGVPDQAVDVRAQSFSNLVVAFSFNVGFGFSEPKGCMFSYTVLLVLVIFTLHSLPFKTH